MNTELKIATTFARPCHQIGSGGVLRARKGLSRIEVTNCGKHSSRESNTRGKPLLEGQSTTGWQPVSPSRLRTRLFSLAVHRVCGVGPSTASSGRRGRSRPHTMHDHTDDEQDGIELDTSGCVRGASGVPPTRPAAVRAFYRLISGGQLTTSGASGVYRCYARERTRTPGRGHTYARLRKVGIPLTSLTRVRGPRRSYQKAEVSQ